MTRKPGSMDQAQLCRRLLASRTETITVWKALECKSVTAAPGVAD
jgi:hypothetical protein